MFAALTATAVATVLGAVLAAFTPRLVHRLSVEPGSPPRSACERCTRPFPHGRPGWVRPGARCPGCGARLGPRTGTVVALGAAICGLLTAGLTGTDGIDPALPAVLALAVVGLPLALIDLACLRLPDPLLALAAVAVLLGLGGATIVLGTSEPLLRALLAALASAAGYVLLALLPGSRLGFGDVKLAALLGLPLGWFGWPVLLLGLFLPHLINGVVGLALLATGRVGRGSTWAFGPALLAGALFALLLG
ncbi:leader peptidase (prepilin peptidase)/N-methyltransferase [Micromonospora pisi]|uniref:Leader peptidase (Prepilin peptidase)/N-methyltransferase n=1 Tax=Micromonospora pisi TaxID=589240 RepID=A0A495JJY2_9ACTN|nr:prepilin peptidase [Micromonospora pisi]RKR89326.1 leader peptidase (prepilin peptidase)/N-methyltransferase [Micromonospora pisi]